MSDVKILVICNCLIKIFGFLLVGIATYITNNANCLWALLIVLYCGMEYKGGNIQKERDHNETTD